MSSTILNITLDCADPHRIARFWAEVTGWDVSQPGPDEFAVGVFAPGRPRMYFHQVPESKAGKNRMHLDVLAADRDQADEIARLLRLGATVLRDRRPEVGWVTLADPEGNEFDVEPGRLGAG
jgi:predicted enzyme related to lactoylglutathione lyase